ncbi:MAG: tripartite tricarboxylate transporter substrate binding protein [Burkholderiales bacterium]|nr:tripartite tricarboxylate transporter substrate binding protein [Burkholderiales bacterium]
MSPGRLLCVTLAGLLPVFAYGADYPARPIRLVVGFAPGGGLDMSCRYWGQKLTARTGQQVIVDNRPGAASELAVKLVIAAPADGHTLLCTSPSATILSSKPKPAFDIRSAVAPVIQMTQYSFAIYVNPALPVKSMKDLVAYARSRPGQLNYGSVGAGSTTNLAFELIKMATGIDIVHVPYKGTAQTTAAAIGGEIQVGLDAAAAVRPHFEAGRLRPIGVSTLRRSPAQPNLPAMEEAGIAGVNVVGWSGLTAPARTPGERVQALSAHFNAILKEDDVKAQFANLGYETAGGTPQDFGRLLADEVATWSKVIKAANIQFD